MKIAYNYLIIMCEVFTIIMMKVIAVAIPVSLVVDIIRCCLSMSFIHESHSSLTTHY